MSPPAASKGGMGGMSLVTTVMAFSVSAFFVLFVFTRLLCARLRMSRAAAAAGRAGDAFVLQAYSVERGIHGLEPSVVRSFPTVKLAAGEAQRPQVQEESQCTVCLEEYEAKDVVRVLPACGHAFHAPCIDAWLRQHPTCPVCRASLRAGKATAAAAAANRATPPLDHRLAAAAAASADRTDMVGADDRLEIVSEEPPASAGNRSPAAAAATAASVDTGAAASPRPAADGTGMVGADDRLEIVSEDSDDRSPAAAAAAAAAGGSGRSSPCCAERQSAGASVHSES